ncbi:MAG: tyrosine-type recombinase/integrase [Saccharofermentanales bacterium]|jgi:integrase
MNIKEASKSTFAEIYRYYCYCRNPKMKDSSIRMRDVVFKHHILPYFKNKTILSIKCADVEQWQGIILRKNLSPSRTRVIHSYLSSVFLFCESRFEIGHNPCKQAGAIGHKKTCQEMKFWSVEEFSKVIRNVSNYEYKVALYILFWTGLRKSELYGLTWVDFDRNAGLLEVNKAYVRTNRSYYLGTLKNVDSYRTVSLPQFLVDILVDFKEYKKKNKKIFRKTDLIITWSKRKLEDAMREGERKAKVKQIRVHDLRHSHALLCLESKVNIVAISKRLGHSKTSVTVDMYGHMRPKNNEQLLSWMNEQYERCLK